MKGGVNDDEALEELVTGELNNLYCVAFQILIIAGCMTLVHITQHHLHIFQFTEF